MQCSISKLVSRKLYPSALRDPFAQFLRDGQLTSQARVVRRADRKLELLVLFVCHFGEWRVAPGGCGWWDQDVAGGAFAVPAAGGQNRRKLVPASDFLRDSNNRVSVCHPTRVCCERRETVEEKRTMTLSPS